MPTLAELRSRYSSPTSSTEDTPDSEEMLVVDARGAMSPTQMVEAKLRWALQSGVLASAELITPDGKRRGAK